MWIRNELRQQLKLWSVANSYASCDPNNKTIVDHIFLDKQPINNCW